MFPNSLLEGKHQGKCVLHRNKTKSTMVPPTALTTQCHVYGQWLSPDISLPVSNRRHVKANGRLFFPFKIMCMKTCNASQKQIELLKQNMILKDPIVLSSCAKEPNCVLQSGSTHRDKMSVKCSFTGNHLHTKHAPLPLLIRQEGHTDNGHTTPLLPFRQQMSGLLFRGLG